MVIGSALMRVLFISQIGEPDCHDLSVYENLVDGQTDIAWFAARLAELGLSDRVEVTGVDVCAGQRILDPDAFAAAIIGGSYHMVSEARPWQQRILDWLTPAAQFGRPVLGICGGHQLMGVHQGARVEPLSRDGYAGTMPIGLTRQGARHWLFHGVAAETGYHFGNYEHLTTVPAGSTVLATRPDSPAIALDYGNNWVGVQFHPEMSANAMSASWLPADPIRAGRYSPSPQAAHLLRNFLDHAGLNANYVIGSKRTS